MNNELLTVKETSEYLKTNLAYVYKLLDAGLLEFLILGRKKIRKVTLENFLSKWEGWDLTDPFNPVKIESAVKW